MQGGNLAVTQNFDNNDYVSRLGANSEPGFKIIRQEYNHDECEMKITLRDQYGLIINTTSREVMKNTNVINNLSCEDVVRIGYIAGFENSNYI